MLETSDRDSVTKLAKLTVGDGFMNWQHRFKAFLHQQDVDVLRLATHPGPSSVAQQHRWLKADMESK